MNEATLFVTNPSARHARIRSLRRQIEAWERLRKVMASEMDHWEYGLIGDAVQPFIDAALHDLACQEQGEGYQPYPHPHETFSSAWWAAYDPPNGPNT